MILKKIISSVQKSLTGATLVLFAFCGLYACASLGSPSGGEIDTIPPQFVSSKPAPDAVNFAGKKIEIVFDELVVLDKPSDKIIVTPPQKNMPKIRAAGNRVTVEFQDSLQPATTYTIDFTNSIVDNNEKNPLENFSFAFSTGETVDSLVISGVLLAADNLEPQQNVMVGLHSDLSDTAFTKLPFLRTTKTNDRGRFWIRNVAPGSYKVYALGDLNRNYKFDQPGESVAFLDSIIVPGFEPAVRPDTIWQKIVIKENKETRDSLIVDTVFDFHYTRFTPDSLRLFLFKKPVPRQFLSKSERSAAYKFSLAFNEPITEFPALYLLNQPVDENWVIPQKTEGGKVIQYWITDSLLYNRIDTLQIEAVYLKTDSIAQLIPATDTLRLVSRAKAPAKDSKKDKEEAIKKPDFLDINLSAGRIVEVYDTVKIRFSEPVVLDSARLHFAQKVDTTWHERSFPVIQNADDPLQYWVSVPPKYGVEYRLQIDSAAIVSIYGKWNNTVNSTFKFQEKEEYGALYIPVDQIEGPGFGELLSSADKVVRQVPLVNAELAFPDLKPGKYYVRYIVDKNNNGKWDTGDYVTQLKPETVYYYPGMFEIPKNWDINAEAWNPLAVPVEKQKPLEITKNKPAEKKKRQNESTTSSGTSRTNSPGGQSLPSR